jgi:hypothetical protein
MLVSSEWHFTWISTVFSRYHHQHHHRRQHELQRTGCGKLLLECLQIVFVLSANLCSICTYSAPSRIGLGPNPVLCLLLKCNFVPKRWKHSAVVLPPPVAAGTVPVSNTRYPVRVSGKLTDRQDHSGFLQNMSDMSADRCVSASQCMQHQMTSLIYARRKSRTLIGSKRSNAGEYDPWS